MANNFSNWMERQLKDQGMTQAEIGEVILSDPPINWVISYQGMTQAEIGEVIGVGEGTVKQHSVLMNKIVTQVLDACKQYQNGRVTVEVTPVTFDFTEGWFRTSGLYDLTAEFQLRLIDEFIADKFNWNKAKVQQTSAKYKLWQEMITTAESELQDKDLIPEIIAMIKNGAFKSIEQLLRKIQELNEKAKNKLICGDCLIELEKLPDASIDLVITDPPQLRHSAEAIGGKYCLHIGKPGAQ